MTEEAMAGDLDAEFDLEAIEKKKAKVLRTLLDEQVRDSSKILTTRGHMGASDAYQGTVTMDWARKNLALFVQLALIKHKMVNTTTGGLVVDQTTVNEIRQRAPSWARRFALASYLLRHHSRKFPPILVVVSEPWVDDPTAPEWVNGRARRTSIPVRYLDTGRHVAVLDMKDVAYSYILDGSHRWLAIDGVLELLQTGAITLYNNSNKAIGKKTFDQLREELDFDEASIRGFAGETIGVEFIPAVVENETIEDAKIRIRSVFVHVNKTAQPPTAGETTLLDEDDGFAIVARTMGLEHPLFGKDQKGDRINWKTTALPAGSRWLTGATTLREMTSKYLGNAEPFNTWGAKKREVAVRPSDAHLKKAMTEMRRFFDRVMGLPAFAKVTSATAPTPIDELREFPPDGSGHLLLRPLGQLVLAETVGYLCQDENGAHLEIDDVFDKLRTLDKSGGFENVVEPTSYWYGLTYDPVRKGMSMEGRVPAVLMLRHLLHKLTDAEKDTLLAYCQKVRTIESAQGTIALNFDGTDVKDPAKITLPPSLP